MRSTRPHQTVWAALFVTATAALLVAGCEDQDAGTELTVATSPGEEPSATTPTSGQDEPPAGQTSRGATASSSPDGEEQPDSDVSPATPSRAKKRSSSAGVRDITFDDIKFDIEKDEPYDPEKLTEGIENLDGDRIRIRGYILPSFQQSGITQFVLVRDNQECCFGPGAALYDCIVVQMQPGKSTDYTVRPVAVEGTFRIQELMGPDGKHLAIYHLDGEQVE